MRRSAEFPILVAILLLAAAPTAATDASPSPAARLVTPSGLPVPRFAGLKYAETSCRAGPSFEHRVAVTYLRQGLPVQIVAETIDHWRKVRDVDGVECWMHKSTLRAATHVVTLVNIDLRAAPEAGAPARARLAAGVVARLDGRRRDWRRISAGGLNGWTHADGLWGADL